MTKHTHTPGPWGLDNNASDEREPSEWVIGPMVGRSIVGVVKSNCSDARLIAAAPELLEALEEILDCTLDLTNRRVNATRAAKAAIAKARGES